LRQKKCNIELPLIAEIEIFGTFKKIYIRNRMILVNILYLYIMK